MSRAPGSSLSLLLLPVAGLPVMRLPVVGLAVCGLVAGCHGGSGPRDVGVRRDAAAAPVDAGLDLDADLDAAGGPPPLDAGPSSDADQDVGPIDAFALDAFALDAFSASRDGGASVDGFLDARLPTGACGVLWARGDTLPTACLPRCAAESGDLFEGCFGDVACEATVIERDTTRAARLYVWPEPTLAELDCSACVGTQRYSCWDEVCPTQAAAWVDCVAVRMAAACTREQGILERCLTPRATSVGACVDERVTACFAAR